MHVEARDIDDEEPCGWDAGKSASGAGSTVVMSEFGLVGDATTPSTTAGKSADGTGGPASFKGWSGEMPSIAAGKSAASTGIVDPWRD